MARQKPEAIFQAKVLDLARFYQWRRAHFRVAYQPGAGKWVTPMSGEPGFPDLVLLRSPRLIFAELKSATGRVTPNQRLWLDELAGVPGIEVYEWKPNDLEEIHRILKREV